jgi:hypothetical protein
LERIVAVASKLLHRNKGECASQSYIGDPEWYRYFCRRTSTSTTQRVLIHAINAKSVTSFVLVAYEKNEEIAARRSIVSFSDFVLLLPSQLPIQRFILFLTNSHLYWFDSYRIEQQNYLRLDSFPPTTVAFACYHQP